MCISVSHRYEGIVSIDPRGTREIRTHCIAKTKSKVCRSKLYNMKSSLIGIQRQGYNQIGTNNPPGLFEILPFLFITIFCVIILLNIWLSSNCLTNSLYFDVTSAINCLKGCCNDENVNTFQCHFTNVNDQYNFDKSCYTATRLSAQINLWNFN